MAIVLATAAPLAVLAGALANPTTPAADGSGQPQPPSAIPAGGSEWGDPVEGLSVRLESEKPVWDEREVGRTGIGFAVVFKASVRNRGSAAILVAQAQETGELEMDGVWHKWTGDVDVKSSALAPGQELHSIPVIPDEKWRSATTALTETPGKHTFRFAVLAQKPESNRGPDIRVVSNPIEVEFLPSAQQLREAGAPPSTNYVGVWFSGHVVDDETGNLMTNFLMQLGVLDPRKSPEVIWSDGPLVELNFIGGQWSRSPELGGFWGMQSIGPEQKGWARIVAGGYLKAPVSPEPVAGYADVHGLTVRMKRGPELTGVVLDHSGQPAAGAKVFLIDVPKLAVRDGEMGWWFAPAGPQFQEGTATTGASGRFALQGDIRGAKQVVVVSADLRMVWAVTNGGSTNEMKITLPEPATINVRYDIAGDEAEAQLHFQLRCGEMNEDFRKAVKMDIFSPTVANHGQIALTNLTPGAYEFERLKRLALGETAQSPGSNAVRTAIRGRSVLYGYEQRTIIVRAGEAQQVDLVRDTGFALSGQVAGLEATGAPGAFIFVRPAGVTNDSRDIVPGGLRLFLDALTCGKDGNFQTQRLKPGTYSLVAEVDSLTNPPPGTPSTPPTPRDPGYTGAAQVTIPSDGPPVPVQIELHRRIVVPTAAQLLAASRATNAAAASARSAASNVVSRATLEIRCTNDVFKVGDEIPIQFILRNPGTNDYFYFERGEDNGRTEAYKLTARTAAGESIPDPLPHLTSPDEARNRFGNTGNLHPGESLTKTFPLNRWAMIKAPGRYEVEGSCTVDSYLYAIAKSDPITITVLPRPQEEMADYIQDLTNQIAKRLALQAGRTAKAYDGDLHELVMKLIFTGRPEIVPSLFRVLEKSGHEGHWFYEALAYYVPHTEQIRQALAEEAAKMDTDVRIKNWLQDAGNEPLLNRENTDVNTRNWLQFALRNYALTNEAPKTEAGPIGNTMGITLEIRCTNDALKAGDEIPIEFIISNLGTEDYKFENRTYDRSGRMNEYQLFARKADGAWLPDPRLKFRMGMGGGAFQYGVLHPGESYSKIIPLNRWALIQEGGQYEVAGTYFGRTDFNAQLQVKADLLGLTLLPRTEQEMADYIIGLTNQVMAQLAQAPPKTGGPPTQDLADLVMKLMYTCRPQIVPALLRILRENGPEILKDGSTRISGRTSGNEGFYANEALLYYVPQSEEVGEAIVEAATQNGVIGNLEGLLGQYEFDKAKLKPLIERALAAENDDLGEWHNGAGLADSAYYDDAFSGRLIAIATNASATASSRSAALYALAYNRTDEGVQALRSLLNDPDQKLWTPLAIALLNGLEPKVKTPTGRHLYPEDFDSADVRPLLERMLVSTNLTDRIFGASLAEQFGNDALTAKLVALAMDPQRATRDSAINALALNRTEEGLKTLKKLLNNPDSAVSKMAEDAIRNAYTARGTARGRPLLPGDFDPKYGAPEVKTGLPDIR
jgi:hypothetical protein